MAYTNDIVRENCRGLDARRAHQAFQAIKPVDRRLVTTIGPTRSTTEKLLNNRTPHTATPAIVPDERRAEILRPLLCTYGEKDEEYKSSDDTLVVVPDNDRAPGAD